MTGGVDGLGTGIEGTGLAQGAEHERGGGAAPGAAVGGDGLTHEHACLNCGAALIGPWCHACGQHAHVHRTLAAIGHDLLHGVLHFEGKLWRTLPMLAWRPGELTRLYIEGQRARFVSPMALFLFAVFLMFAVFSFLPGGDLGKGTIDIPSQAELSRRIAVQEQRLADPRLTPEQARRARAELDSLEDTRDTLDEAQRPAAAASGIFQAFKHRLAETISHNPDLLFYKLQTNGYKFAWLLIPLSLPFMALTTLGVRGVRFYDHAVFVTYSLAFMSLLFILLVLLARAGAPDPVVPLLATVVPVAHIGKQLKGAYRLGWVGTMLRTVLLLISVVVVLTLFALILLALGLAH